MKITRLLVLGLLATVAISQAEQPLSLIRQNANAPERDAAQIQFSPLGDNIVPSTPIAEATTPQLLSLAQGLESDPVRIFNYVHDHIRHVLYFGSKKGAQLTLLERSGNDFDQCALLVALLRAAGYTNTGYQFGWMKLPYDSPDHKDLHHWLQLNVTNNSWTYTTNYLRSLIYTNRGYPATAAIWDTNTFAFQRMWVLLTNAGNVYYLDPAFKVHEPIAGTSIQTATGFTSNSLMSAAGGTYSASSVSNLNESSLRGNLTICTSNLLNWIQSNGPNASVAQVLGGWQVVPSTNTSLSQSIPFTTYDWGGQMPILSWANQPTNMMSTFSVNFAYTNYQCYMPQLAGQRVMLTYDYWSTARLYLEDNEVAEEDNAFEDVVISVNHPIGYWDTVNNKLVNTTAYDQSTTNTFVGNFNSPWWNAYNICYAFEPDWSWLQQRQDWLDYLRQAGNTDDSFDVTCETLNVMGLQYQLQSWLTEQILAMQAGVLPQHHHFMGRAVQEGGNGYYFDFFLLTAGDASSTGTDATNADRVARFECLASYFGSALEHGVIEQRGT